MPAPPIPPWAQPIDQVVGRKRTAKPPGGSTPRVASTGPAPKRVKKDGKDEQRSAETVSVIPMVGNPHGR